mmetsp:Transcript_1641/g.2741  ORF Transcript_1641/g.2741 Transcript_1641/m.2741 type:complete len:317 (+) Transcript_1641:2859-3809(+)|eukprot:CAMPEP_0182614450 /NCGR_PEP_ID=MMETSP1330-20130603/30508_1 /TAXON_ID=464278 /ORGANISM="Picochlorum sp., Strain RCC944" /LENGTH=316 /DNA_ID=CAMNT_0024834263 /DNA_START=255 /DNA_END=1205 /DNA_ORIENTATION=+
MLKQKHSNRLLLAAVAALCVLGLAKAVDVPSNVDFSFNDLPKSGELVNEIFSVLAGGLNEQHTVSEDEVKRHLLRQRPATVGSLLGLGAGRLASINYTQVYESFTDTYCTDPSDASSVRPPAPSIDIADVLYTTTTYTGPTLGIQISLGACEDQGDKTFRCRRPELVIVKSPASISKAGPSIGASKPGGTFVDKRCAWSESQTIGHGESAELYNGGSEIYDYSGYRAALLGRVHGRFGRIGSMLSGIASRSNARKDARKGARQAAAQAVSQFRMPRLGGLFRRRGLSEEFDMHNLDPQTHDRLDAVLPGFFKKEDN